MLVLGRKPGERIILSNGVTITVLSVIGEQVRVGVEAPEDVSIFREELYKNVLRETGKPPSRENK